MNISTLYKKIKFHFIRNNSAKYIEHLRKRGIEIGNGNEIQWNCIIDETRPSLVTIGDNNFFSTGFTLLTHDWVTTLFRNKYHELLPSSGCVTIGNNNYFGQKVTVLKGVTIGDNCIIGLGSIITHDIPSNSVVVGCPAKVIGNTDDYFEKRKQECIEESFEYVRAFEKRNQRRPVLSDLWEEFPLFVDKTHITAEEEQLARRMLRGGYEAWLEKHVAPFGSLEEFIQKAEK